MDDVEYLDTTYALTAAMGLFVGIGLGMQMSAVLVEHSPYSTGSLSLVGLVAIASAVAYGYYRARGLESPIERFGGRNA